jgi:hypothetical protein
VRKPSPMVRTFSLTRRRKRRCDGVEHSGYGYQRRRRRRRRLALVGGREIVKVARLVARLSGLDYFPCHAAR